MAGQMCWLSQFGTDGTKILHLRLEPNQPWRPYTAYPQHSVADYPMLKGSKGWSTYQRLFRAGWVLIPSAKAYELSPQLSLARSR